MATEDDGDAVSCALAGRARAWALAWKDARSDAAFERTRGGTRLHRSGDAGIGAPGSIAERGTRTRADDQPRAKQFGGARDADFDFARR